MVNGPGAARKRRITAAYLNDVIIFSKTWEEHLRHVQQVLQRLDEAGLTVKMSKCQFGMARCVYLGHVVGSGEVRPNPTKIEAVKSFPVPTTKKDVRVFLGLTGYYSRPWLPLFLILYTMKTCPTKVKWTNLCRTAFETLKNLLCDSPILNSPDFTMQALCFTNRCLDQTAE